MATTTDTSTTKLSPSSGVHVATREASGALDTWHEHLYAIPGEGGVWLGVCGHKALGKVPGAWYDEDGELLPMHRTGDGGLRLPEVFEGQEVVDVIDGMFVGERELIGDAVPVADLEDDTVRLALGALEWTMFDAEFVKEAVDRLQGGTGATVGITTQPADAATPLMARFFAIVRGEAVPRQNGKPWRRVAIRGGLVHWVGGDEEEE
jgi:hypothetical protein